MADIASVYSDARLEYTKQLSSFIVPAYFQFFLSLLEKARIAAEPGKLLWQFQLYLNDIPEWNMEKVATEIDRLQADIKCDYLEDLLTAVFIAHTKVLTAIRISSKNKNVQVVVPQPRHFLFRVLCEAAKAVWGNAFLFREDVRNIEKQQNYRTVETLLAEAVLSGIRSLVPVKSILKDFVADREVEPDEEVETVTPAPAATLLGQGTDVDMSGVLAAAPTAPAVEPAAPVESAPEPVPEQVSESAPASEPAPEVPPPRIVVEDIEKGVGFTDYDTVIDREDPDRSDIIYEPKDGRDSPSSEIEILEELPYNLDGSERVPTISDGFENSELLPIADLDVVPLA